MDLLTETATRDRQPLCRLAAVEKLGHFKDPRTLTTLEAAFYAAQELQPDLMIRVQCQAITSIGQSGNPAAVKFLVEKLKEPPAERSDFAQQRSDRCIAAARALAKFKDPQATAALAQTMQKEKNDMALKRTACMKHWSKRLARTCPRTPTSGISTRLPERPSSGKTPSQQDQTRELVQLTDSLLRTRFNGTARDLFRGPSLFLDAATL